MRLRPALTLTTTIALTLFLVAPVVLQGQKGKPKPVTTTIPLEATFREAASDRLRSDGARYRAGGPNTVEIDDEGDLMFDFPARAGRSIHFDFTDQVRAGTSSMLPPGPEDPIVDWSFFTMWSGADSKLDFKTMQAGDVKPVRLFFWITTRSGKFLVLRAHAAAPNPGSTPGGDVQVTASDEDGDGEVETWVVEPLPGDLSFQLIKPGRAGQTRLDEDLGDYQLPFLITFKRLVGVTP